MKSNRTWAKTVELAKVVAKIMRNALWGGSLAFVWQALLSPSKALNYLQECLFQYENLFGRKGALPKHVTAALDCNPTLPIVLGSAKHTGADSWFAEKSSYTLDLVSLCQLCRILNPSIVFEIGTLKGFTAWHFALNTNAEAAIYTLDLPPAGVKPLLRTTLVDDIHIAGHQGMASQCFDGTSEGAKIRRVFGDSATFDFSGFHGKVDLFFIDGAHSYEYVRSDTMNALLCTRKGGVIAWHDFGRVGVNGVGKLIEEMSRSYKIFAVPGGSVAYMVKE